MPSVTPATPELALLQLTSSRSSLDAGVPLFIVPERATAVVPPTTSDRLVGETVSEAKVTGFARP
jgi:hypothetical protein